MKDIDASLHKVPPQNLEAEQSVLGGILLDNLALNTVLELLETSDFYSEAHRKIFSSIVELSNRNEPCDLITLSNILKDQKRIEQVGGTAYLASLVDNVPSAVNIAYYAKIIKEKSILRRLIGTATEILNKSYDAGMDIDSVLDEAEHAIFEISENKIRPSFYPIRDIIKDSFKTIERLYAKKELVTGVATGFDKIDDITSGLQKSDLIIIAGRPSMGKTAFALNIAQYAALEMGVPVAIFSLEMAKEQLATRMLAAEARVDSQRLRKGFLGETDWPKLTTAAGRLSEAPIYIDDTPAITVIEMKAKSRRLKAENGLGLIILDYLQLMRGSSLQGFAGAGNFRNQPLAESPGEGTLRPGDRPVAAQPESGGPDQPPSSNGGSPGIGRHRTGCGPDRLYLSGRGVQPVGRQPRKGDCGDHHRQAAQRTDGHGQAGLPGKVYPL